MNKHLYWYLFATLVSGCSVVSSHHKAPPQQQTTPDVIINWIDNQEFQKASTALARSNPNHPEHNRYTALQTQLDSSIADYERQLISRAAKSLEANRWTDALNEYDAGLAKIPHSTRLRKELDQIEIRRKAEVKRVENKLLTLRGEYMVKALPAYEKIAALKPRSDIAQHQLDDAVKNADNLALEISALGSARLIEGREDNGAYLLKLATSLTLDPIVLNSYRDYLSTQNSKPLSAKTARKQPLVENAKLIAAEKKNVNRSIAEYDKLFQAGKFHEAKAILNKLRSKPEYSQAIAPREKRLKSAISDQVAILYQQGVDYYSKENYEIALNHWVSVLKLAPNHEKAKEYTERTKRILIKLEQLREKQHIAPNESKPSNL